MSREKDEVDDVVKDFMTLSPKKCAIYSTKDVRNDKLNNVSLSALMSNISMTIETLHRADEVRIKRQYRNNLNPYKKDHFVPVQSLDYNSVVTSNAKPLLKFETQCFSGTQLLNVVETAEAIFDSEDEITKEFKVPFNITNDDKVNNTTQRSKENNDNDIDSHNYCVSLDNKLLKHRTTPIERDNELNGLNFTLNSFQDKSKIIKDDRVKSPILNVRAVGFCNSSNIEINKINDFFNREKKNVESIESDVITPDNNLGSIDKNLSSLEIKDLNAFKPKYNNNEIEYRADTVPRSISPILNIGSTNSIVIDLKTFEDFENLHMQPIIIENKGSQTSPLTECNIFFNETKEKEIAYENFNKEKILNDKVTLNNNTNIFIQTSPIKAIYEDKYEVENFDKNPKEIIIADKNTTSNKLILKDELLFSSDDEDNFINNKLESVNSSRESSSNSNCEDSISTLRNDLISQAKYDDDNFKSITLTYKENKIHNKVLTPNQDATSNDIKNIKTDDDLVKSSHTFNNHIIISNPSNNEYKYENKINRESILKINRKKEDDNKCLLGDLENSESLSYFKDIDLKNIINYTGFSKASNKSLKRTKKISDDISNQKESFFDNIDTTMQNIYPGFKTASNKNIVISDEALQQTMKIFKDIEKYSPISCFDSYEKNTTILPELNTATFVDHDKLEKNIIKTNFGCEFNKNILKARPYSGFITSNKLDRNGQTKEIQDCDSNISNLAEKNHTIIGFATASSKSIHISKESIEKTKHIFDDLEQDAGENNCNDKISVIHKNTYNDITLTQKDKILSVPNPIQSNNNDQNDENKKVKILEDILINTNRQQKNKLPFLGFTTASNKTVDISKDALDKTKNIFNDIKFTQSDIIVKSTKNGLQEKHETPNIGFTTASNKTVDVSKDALDKTKNIFNDIKFTQSDIIVKSTRNGLEEKHETPNIGFTTASNKTVDVSKDALDKTKNIFNDIKFTQSDIIVKSTRNGLQVEHETPNIGFTTASNKTVDVSKDALDKAKRLFEDIKFTQSHINTQKTNNNKNKHKTYDKGFTTASNKKVDVYEKALDKTKSLFNDIKCTQNDIVLHSVNKKVEHNVDSLSSENFNVDKLLNTQVIKNFEESIYLEDYCDTLLSNTSKRSGSPILQSSLKRNKKYGLPPQNNIKTNIRNEIKVFKFNTNYKNNKKMFLKDIKVNSAIEKQNTFLYKYSFDNLLNIKFDGPRNHINDDTIDIKELIEMFNRSVDSNIIPKGWIQIHLKLILWKLISYERKFGENMFLICNTTEVLHQLKYRYDRELNKMERPALRKIYERDDLASKSLVLCVVKIVQENNDDQSQSSNLNSTISLKLTDGWYFIHTVIDKFLMKMVLNGKITVGTKLMTIGAELLNCDQGCEPWEDTSNVRLKIFGNSTRRVRWHTRLGYHGNASILTPLSAVSIEGGKVSKMRVFVARVYPMLFIEKFDDGSTVTRSQRQEELYQNKFEQERQIEIEKIMEEIENETEDLSQDSRDEYRCTGTKRKSYESGSQIAKVMKSCKDVPEFVATLTSSQLNLLTEFTTKKQEEKITKLQERVQEKIKNKCSNLNRNVIALLKVQIADYCQRKGCVSSILSIWKANESYLEIIKENSWIDIFDVTPTAFRNNELHLSAGLRSNINATIDTHKKSKMVENMDKIKRTCTPINELLKSINTKKYEIDTVGLIFLIEPTNVEFDKQTNTNQNFQNIYLTDEYKNFICINFWGGLKKHGFDNSLQEGIFVAGINLQKRVGNTRKNIPHFRVTEFSYFTKTPKFNDARNLIDNLNNKFKSISIKAFCADCVELKKKKEKMNSHISPYRVNDRSEYNLSKHKQFMESPLINNPSNLTPEQIFKKRIIQEKMAKLEKYGEPPPLCPLNIINTSTKIFDEYKSPLLKNNVATIENIQPNNDSPKTVQGSPVFNKNVIKRSYGNPVRLDFNKQNDSVDHFAEEFDCSPPLSFDCNS